MSLSWPCWPGITLWPLRAAPGITVAGDHEVPAALRDRADRAWDRLGAANPRMFDGPILSLAEFDPGTGGVVCRRASYKWLAVQEEVETGVTLVAVNGVVTARDGAGVKHFLLARRSPGTWKYGGMWELSPAGGLGPAPDGPLPLEALIDQLRRELLEEAGIEDPLVGARPIGFYRDAAARSFNVIFRAALSRPLEGVTAATRATHWDTDATRWVAQADLPAFLAGHGVIDSSRAILAWLSLVPPAVRPAMRRDDSIRLRPTTPNDLPALFELQDDAESNEMAGTKPRTREAFFAAWESLFVDPSVRSRVIELDGRLVGSIGCFQAEGRDCVGYWVARGHWGRGIASRALALFLTEEPRRPLHATTASGNAASRRILEKCGFRCTGVRMGEETGRYLPREVADFLLEA